MSPAGGGECDSTLTATLLRGTSRQ